MLQKLRFLFKKHKYEILKNNEKKEKEKIYIVLYQNLENQNFKICLGRIIFDNNNQYNGHYIDYVNCDNCDKFSRYKKYDFKNNEYHYVFISGYGELLFSNGDKYEVIGKIVCSMIMENL
jgi:hypothetical protein